MAESKLYSKNGFILYDNDNPSSNGAGITLSDSAANYFMFIICFKSNDNDYNSLTVIHPNNKYITLTSVRTSSDSAHAQWIKNSTYEINGTSISIPLIGSYYPTGQTNHTGSHTMYYDRLIAITQVIGFK